MTTGSTRAIKFDKNDPLQCKVAEYIESLGRSQKRQVIAESVFYYVLNSSNDNSLLSSFTQSKIEAVVKPLISKFMQTVNMAEADNADNLSIPEELRQADDNDTTQEKIELDNDMKDILSGLGEFQ